MWPESVQYLKCSKDLLLYLKSNDDDNSNDKDNNNNNNNRIHLSSATSQKWD